MQITWTNCAEQMPPDDKDVICKSYVTDGSIKYTKVVGALFKLTTENWQWTEFTKEKWEALNK